MRVSNNPLRAVMFPLSREAGVISVTIDVWDNNEVSMVKRRSMVGHHRMNTQTGNQR